MDWRRTARWAALTGLALSLLTACTVSMSGGLLGALASIGLAMVVFLLAGATQTGCVEDVSPCLSIASDWMPDEGESDGGRVDMPIGPCLSPPEPDLGPDVPIGPCLSPPEPDLGPDLGPDMPIGPCLSLPELDQGVVDQGPDLNIGPCLDVEPDQGVDAAPDLSLQPCLSPPPPPDPEDGSGKAPGVDRAAIFDKVAASLPADLAARLKKRG